MDASDDVIDVDIKNAKQHPNFSTFVSWMMSECGVDESELDFGSDDGDKLEDMISWISFLFQKGKNKSRVAPTSSLPNHSTQPGVLTVFTDAKAVEAGKVPQTCVLNREVVARYFDPTTHKASTTSEYQKTFSSCAPPARVVQRPKAAEELAKQADLRSAFAMSSKGSGPGAAVDVREEISQQPPIPTTLTLEQELEKMMDEESIPSPRPSRASLAADTSGRGKGKGIMPGILVSDVVAVVV